MCYKSVGAQLCNYCKHTLIKYGLVNQKQRYRCKNCKRTQMGSYTNNACYLHTNTSIVSLLIEGCGIRSIARLLAISAVTTLKRIRSIANAIKKPMILTGSVYEVDELRTYVRNKNKECWVIYALDKQRGYIVDLKVGSRTKKNLKRVTDTLLMSNCKQVYTDGLKIYRELIPQTVHKVIRYGTNKIERKNLSLRTHLKRLNRKTICFSKSKSMLEACLKIYFWHDKKPTRQFSLY